jgi:ABC-type molybdate transport system ATPase subunit
MGRPARARHDLAVLAGLAVPQRGRVVLGKDVWLYVDQKICIPTHQRQLAYVFQGLALFRRTRSTSVRDVAGDASRDAPSL